MEKKKNSKFLSNFGSNFVTFLVIAVIFIVGPVSAITVMLNSGADSVNEGEIYEFEVSLEINKDERTSIELVDIVIGDGYEFYNCYFNKRGEKMKCDDSFVEIIKMSAHNCYGYGYGYGYNDNCHDDKYGYDYGYNYGYGYGYGYDTGKEVKYIVKWLAPQVENDTMMYVTSNVFTKDEEIINGGEFEFIVNNTVEEETFIPTSLSVASSQEEISQSNGGSGIFGTLYHDGTFVDKNGNIWNYIQSRETNLGNQIDGEGLIFRGSEFDSKLTSQTLSGGISNLKFDVKKAFSSEGPREIEVFINGVSYGTTGIIDSNGVQSIEIEDIDVDENFIISFVAIGEREIIIDNIEWTSYDSEDLNAEILTSAVGDFIPIESEEIVVESSETNVPEVGLGGFLGANTPTTLGILLGIIIIGSIIFFTTRSK